MARFTFYVFIFDKSEVKVVHKETQLLKDQIYLFAPHSGFIKVLDGNGTQIFTREGCQTNHTLHTFHEIAFEETQNITIQVALKNYQSYVRVSYCVLENGLGAGKNAKNLNAKNCK